MWDGIYVMSPDAEFRASDFVGELVYRLRDRSAISSAAAIVLPGLNVSDRVEGWHKNYRIPTSPSTSPATRPGIAGRTCAAAPILPSRSSAKATWPAGSSTSTPRSTPANSCCIDRDPWALELYRLADGRLELVGDLDPGRARDPDQPVLPLTFRLVPGEGRPTLEVARLDGGQTWRI